MNDEQYMQRCFDLARLGGGNVGRNPNVGALLVHEGEIIGEGYHQYFGGPHAEVNAFESVSTKNVHRLKDATLYVSLEPCNIHRKTPPCSALILKHQVKKLKVGCEDPNPAIAGSSLTFLRNKGVAIEQGILEKEAKNLIRPFTINILENRPFITIKFAQSQDHFLSKKGEQTWLSNEYSKVFSHKLRSENQGILIGVNTALIDNPSLTTRLYPGAHPLRICIDPSNKLSQDSNLLQDEHQTLIINEKQRNSPLNSGKEQWTGPINLSSIMKRLYEEKGIGRLIVEGGADTIKRFVAKDLWDQAMIINCPIKLGSGVAAPTINGSLMQTFEMGDNVIWQIRK